MRTILRLNPVTLSEESIEAIRQAIAAALS